MRSQVYCKEVIKTKGLKHVTVEDLVAEITPHGRCMPLLSVVACWCLLMLMLLLLSCAAVNLFIILLLLLSFPTFTHLLWPARVPDAVKAELLQKIRQFLK